MRPLTLVSPEPSRAVLQQEINRHQDARYDHRLHGVLLVAFGLSCGRGAGIFGDSPRTVANWVRRFDQQGLAGLAEGNHSGRPTRLSAEQLEGVHALVRQPPTAAGLEFNLWDGRRLAACVQQRFGLGLSVRQCQRLFHLVATRYRLRRPLAAKADPQRQAGHKKTPGVGAGSNHRLVVFGRSPFLPAWFPLPEVGAVGGRRPGRVALSGAQERGVLRGRAAAGWGRLVPSGSGDV